MKETKCPTIIDVTCAANVGSSTVSRHVRGGKSVSPEVARQIEIAIAQLGYGPNTLARSLRVGRTRTLGVLFPHVNNVFFGNAIRTIQTEARVSGFTVMLLTHHEEMKLQQEQLASLKQLRRELCAALQRKRGPATAILSMSYSVTLAILSTLRDCHIALSEIGFIGIDDMEFANFIHPPLTTLAQPAEQFARLAFRQLLERTSGSKEKPVHVVVAGSMMIRSSCGCKQASSRRL